MLYFLVSRYGTFWWAIVRRLVRHFWWIIVKCYWMLFLVNHCEIFLVSRSDVFGESLWDVFGESLWNVLVQNECKILLMKCMYELFMWYVGSTWYILWVMKILYIFVKRFWSFRSWVYIMQKLYHAPELQINQNKYTLRNENELTN